MNFRAPTQTAFAKTRFLTGLTRSTRMPGPLMWLGAWLYWFLGRCRTAPPVYLTRAELERREPLLDTNGVRGGLEYSDYRLVDGDARFVFGFVQRFVALGGVAVNYVELKSAEHTGDAWRLGAVDMRSGRALHFRAACLVNACGPWADAANRRARVPTTTRHLLSKGVHLVVPRVGTSERVLTSFASDGRMFFVIPFGVRVAIGTTDTRTQDPREGVLEEDRHFILENANARLALPRPLTRADVLSERCGVRPLAVEGADRGHDWVQLSRKHIIETDDARRHVSIFGGKLTSCLSVGAEVADAVAAMGLPGERRARWFGEPRARREGRVHGVRAQCAARCAHDARRERAANGAALAALRAARTGDCGAPARGAGCGRSYFLRARKFRAPNSRTLPRTKWW